MELFSIGDQVVCIDSKPAFGYPSKLIEGKKYVVNSSVVCACGVVGITVGIAEDIFTGMVCKCGRRHVNPGERVYSQFRFIKPETEQQLEDAIREAVNEPLKVLW